MPLEEAERRYGLSRSTLFRWLREGKIRGFRKPNDRRTYVNGSDIRKLERYPLIPYMEATPAMFAKNKLVKPKRKRNLTGIPRYTVKRAFSGPRF